MARFSSPKSSFQYLYDAPLQGQFTTLDDYFTSHVCGFCATSLCVRSGSRPTHQVTGEGFLAATSGATQNQAQVGSSSGFIIINETAVIPLKWRTLKCLFLLALASARRRSYLHALSIALGRCVFARGNTQCQLVVSLLPEPGFLAKNQLPTQAPEWITVPGIAHLNPTEPERMLCPVRQLKLYIRDSERIRGGRQRMFIHWNRGIRDIMRSHISRWIVETVKEAYNQADRQYDRVTAHEVRALSAS